MFRTARHKLHWYTVGAIGLCLAGGLLLVAITPHAFSPAAATPLCTPSASMSSPTPTKPPVPTAQPVPTARPVPTAQPVPTPQPVPTTPPKPQKAVTLQRQNPQLPNGCEVTSLAMLLGWAGYPVEKMELYQGYLPRQDLTESPEGWTMGGNPEDVYVGDATSKLDGWYCFEGPIVEAGNAYLRDQGSNWTAQAVSGLSQRQFNKYLKNDVPLVAWVTLDYTAPVDSLRHWYLADGSFYQPLSNLHCVVVVDQEGDNYLTADPLKGWRRVDKASFWSVFDAMGRRAVIINE